LLAGAVFGAPAGHSGWAARNSLDDYCCADDQAVSGWFSDEFNLLHMEWGWPGDDSRALAACDRLGGNTVAPDGRIDTSEVGAFEDSGSVCEPGHGVYERRLGISDRRAFYVQVRFLCNSRYPCGGLGSSCPGLSGCP